MLKINDRVILTDLKGKKWKGTIVNINSYREPNFKYGLDLDLYKQDIIFASENDIKLIEKVQSMKERLTIKNKDFGYIAKNGSGVIINKEFYITGKPIYKLAEYENIGSVEDIKILKLNYTKLKSLLDINDIFDYSAMVELLERCDCKCWADYEKKLKLLEQSQNKVAVEKLEELKGTVNLLLDCSYGSLQIEIIKTFDSMISELKGEKR